MRTTLFDNISKRLRIASNATLRRRYLQRLKRHEGAALPTVAPAIGNVGGQRDPTSPLT